MKKFTLILPLLCAALSFQTASSQMWSDQQKEVWKNVEDYWAISSGENAMDFIDVFHDDFVGWDLDETVPSDKATRAKYIRKFWPMMKTEFYNLKPLSIRVYGDVAVVHYLYHMILVPNEGMEEMGLEMKEENGRWTDVLMKDGGQWKLIADAGGEIEENDDDD
jgi:hypothetical protein